MSPARAQRYLLPDIAFQPCAIKDDKPSRCYQAVVILRDSYRALTVKALPNGQDDYLFLAELYSFNAAGQPLPAYPAFGNPIAISAARMAHEIDDITAIALAPPEGLSPPQALGHILHHFADPQSAYGDGCISFLPRQKRQPERPATLAAQAQEYAL